MATQSRGLYVRVGALVLAGLALALGFVLFLTANRPGNSARQVRDLSPRVGAGPGGGRGGALPRRRHRPGGGARAGVGGIPSGGGRHLRPRLPARLRALLRGHAARGRGARRWRTRSASACAPASRRRASPASTTSNWISWTRNASRCWACPGSRATPTSRPSPPPSRRCRTPPRRCCSACRTWTSAACSANLSGLLADLRQETQEGGDVAESLREAASLLRTLRTAAEEADLPGAVGELRGAAAEARGAAAEARELIASREVRQLLANAAAAAAELRTAAARLPGSIAAIEVRAADGARRHHRDPGRAGADPPGSAQRGRQSAGHDGSAAPLARPGAVRRPAAAGAPLTHALPSPPLPPAALRCPRRCGACSGCRTVPTGRSSATPSCRSGRGASRRRSAGRCCCFAAFAPRRGWTIAGSASLGGGGQVDTEFYNEWAAPPVELVEEAMRQWLAASGLFAAVVSPGSRLRAGLVLEAELLRLQAEPREWPGAGRARGAAAGRAARRRAGAHPRPVHAGGHGAARRRSAAGGHGAGERGGGGDARSAGGGAGGVGAGPARGGAGAAPVDQRGVRLCSMKLRSTAFMRACQPRPWPLNHSITSAS